MKTRLRRWLVMSFGNPRGLGGRVAAFVMAHRSSNVTRNRWAVDLLDLQPHDRFLEVGCGPGVALSAARARTPHVVGVDRSPLMVRIAARRSGARVVEGDAVALPTFEERVDKALAVNTIGFWLDPVAGLKRIAVAMKPGGTIAIVAQPRGGRATDHDEIVAQLTEAGFTDHRIETLDLDPPVTCVLATRQ